jgi:hypothetical protein
MIQNSLNTQPEFHANIHFLPKRKYTASALKSKCSILFTKIISVYSGNHSKHIKSILSAKCSFWMSKKGVYIVKGASWLSSPSHRTALRRDDIIKQNKHHLICIYSTVSSRGLAYLPPAAALGSSRSSNGGPDPQILWNEEYVQSIITHPAEENFILFYKSIRIGWQQDRERWIGRKSWWLWHLMVPVLIQLFSQSNGTRGNKNDS